jgi:hypothetical protein
MKLTSVPYLAPRLEWVKICFHFPIRLHGLEFKKLRPGTTLPLDIINFLPVFTFPFFYNFSYRCLVSFFIFLTKKLTMKEILRSITLFAFNSSYDLLIMVIHNSGNNLYPCCCYENVTITWTRVLWCNRRRDIKVTSRTGFAWSAVLLHSNWITWMYFPIQPLFITNSEAFSTVCGVNRS